MTLVLQVIDKTVYRSLLTVATENEEAAYSAASSPIS
ncbi:MAG: hypothetical protein LZF86_110850 [Nitrospira sp.]|nr:MAG: hypothetical protein LZF86_110850 [Nitrospira sp.]